MRVLVVEDEEAMRASLEDGLVAAGYAVDTAADGEQGLWLAREVDYDAVVLDIMLPVVNGYVVCRTLREEGRWMPVLMLTAKDGHLDEAEGLDTGADDYLTKPFAFEVLLARLRALIRRGGAERPTVLAAGDLVLDPAARTVTRGSTDLDLTAREFAILECLMRRTDEAVTKAEIMAAVWDFAFDGDPNIVEVYVRSLRNKIDRPFDREAIVTVRGAGYRLEGTGG
jgi:two-component system OmpR family response regulator